MKRIFDIVVSISGLILLSPLLMFIALAIVMTNGFPVMFIQQRIGRGGREFGVLKFRTMRVAKEAELGAFDAGNTCRVTKIGRILRKSKLDELPQLWNVLVGEMSVVGPRPEVRKWVEAYPNLWTFVHSVRPGITDPASILFRNEEELLAASLDPEYTYRVEILPKKLDCYQAYIRMCSFWGDIKIVLFTLKVMLWNTSEHP